MKVAARENKGLFVLVRTSNASAGEFQDLIADGLSAIDLAWQHGLALYEALASLGDLIRAGACAPCGPHPSVLAIAPSAGPDLAGADPRKAPESPAISRAVAEILASHHGRTGGSLKHIAGPIHGPRS